MLKDTLTTEDMRERFAHIAKAHHLRLVILYGSVARGTATAMSDVDIGVLRAYPLSPEDEAFLTEEIARATDIPHIEVRSLHRVSPLFLRQVTHEGIVLFADTPTRARELKLYAWKTAAETKPMRDAKYTRMKERIATYA